MGHQQKICPWRGREEMKGEQGSTDFNVEQGCHSYLSRVISQYNVGNIGYGKLVKQ